MLGVHSCLESLGPPHGLQLRDGRGGRESDEGERGQLGVHHLGRHTVGGRERERDRDRERREREHKMMLIKMVVGCLACRTTKMYLKKNIMKK